MQDISLPAPTRGWVLCVGEPGAGQQAKGVYATRDGGLHWRAAAVVSFHRRSRGGGLSGYGYPQGLAMSASGHGVIWESRGFLLLTRNGGRNWTVQKIARPEADFGLWAQPLSNRAVVALLQSERAYRLVVTRNFGRSWHELHRWQR